MIIIDAQAEFRTLLMHHVTTNWPEARITAYDPTEAGSLPDDFSGAGYDLVLLGNALGDSDGMSLLSTFVNTPGFPPVVYFGGDGDRAARRAAREGDGGIAH